MKRKKRSVIWSIDNTEFSSLVKNSNTIGDVLKFFNLSNKGGNSNTVKRRIAEEGIDSSHIVLGKSSNKGRTFSREKTPIEKVCVENSTFNKTHLKKRLIKENILENKCTKCGLLPIWNNQKLVLQLEHKNGISNDHRLENLCLLCPNCHSQTPNFAGKKRQQKDGRKSPRVSRRKVVRPTKEELMEWIWLEPTTKIAKKLGVSDKSVEKWTKYYKIKKPPRGYWSKINSRTRIRT